MHKNVNELKRRIFSQIDRKRDEIVRFCSDIVSIPSENPPGDTTKIAGFLSQYLQEKGFNVEIFEPKKNVPNLVVVYEGVREKPNLVLNAHMDVFPAGDSESWDLPPFSGRVEDGKIWGRGVADMKGGLTAFVVILVLFKEMGVKLPGKLTLSLVSDEETGGRWGTKWLLDNVQVVNGDACLNSEPSGLKAVWVGEKGVCWLRLKTFGKSAHGAVPMLGDNAVVNMSKIITIAESFRQMKIKSPVEIEDVMEEAKSSLEAIPGFGKGLGDLLDHVSVNVGRIRGGTTVNMVPESCEIELDTRLPIGITPQEFKNRLEDELRNNKVGKVNCEFITMTKASYTSPKEDIVRLIRRNAKDLLGEDLKHGFWVGTTDIRFFRQKGIPSAIYGTRMYNVGAVNEYMQVDDLIKIVKIHSGTILDYYES